VATTATNRALTRQLAIVLLLLVLLVVLGLALWWLTRPAAISGQQGERDRNYLFTIYGYEGDLLRRPSSVGVAANGDIHVADTGKRRIVVFDSEGRFVRIYGNPGDTPTDLLNPIDVAVAFDGRSFVVDKSLDKIVVFDGDGTPLDAIEFPDEPPTSVTIIEETLYVTTDSGVLIGDVNGNLLDGHVRRGRAPGEFDRPTGIAVGPDGTMYVADSLNYRVQALSAEGEPLWQYGEPIPADQAIRFTGETRKFGLPASIALDENGLLYVVDGLNSEVAVLDIDGEFVEMIGDIGHDDGFFYYPAGIDYSDNRIIIADKFNDRVQVFSVPGAIVPWAAWAPWLLALLLLPLLLLPLLLRGRKYVATPLFIDTMEADERAPEVAKVLKRVFVAEGLQQRVEEVERFEVKWLLKPGDEAEVGDLAERFGLDRPDAEALAVASHLRGRRVVLAEKEEIKVAAGELGLPVASYEELKTALDAKKKDAEKDADSGEGAPE
jgi:sugar lactone lactonase YvrE